MYRLTILIFILFTFSCSLFQSNIKVRNKSHWDIKFYLNNEFKNIISSDKSKTYEVETGTHKCTAKNLNDELLVEENVKVKFGHDGIWTVYGKMQVDYEDIEY